MYVPDSSISSKLFSPRGLEKSIPYWSNVTTGGHLWCCSSQNEIFDESKFPSSCVRVISNLYHIFIICRGVNVTVRNTEGEMHNVENPGYLEEGVNPLYIADLEMVCTVKESWGSRTLRKNLFLCRSDKCHYQETEF